MANHPFRKSMISGAIAMALTGMGGAAPSFAAGHVIFDIDGSGPGGTVDVADFTWRQNTVLVQGGAFTKTLTTAQTNTAAVMYGQGLLQDLEDPAVSSVGAAANGKFTYVFAINVTATRNGGNTSTGTLDVTNNNPMPTVTSATNDFQIWANAPTTTAQSLGTACFNCGVLILEGTVTLDNNASQPPSLGNPANGVGGAASNFKQTGAVAVNINSATPGGATTQGGIQIKTISGNGNVSLDVKVTFANTNYFKSSIDAVSFDLSLSSAQYNTPFTTINGATYVPGDVDSTPINFGGESPNPLNDFGCTLGTTCDWIAGTASARSGLTVNDTPAPEPGTLAMLGLGLAGLGGALSRRRKRA